MYNLIPVRELLKTGPVLHALKWTGEVMMGNSSISKQICPAIVPPNEHY